MMLRDCRPSWLTRHGCLAVHMALVVLFVAVPKLLAGLSARCLGLSCTWLARTTSGPGEVIGITGGRSLEVVVTFPMPPDASDDLPSQPHMLTRLCQPNPTSLQPFVPAHRTTACDDWLTHGPMMHARPARGLLG